MTNYVLKIDKAKLYTDYPEIIRIFIDLNVITDIEFEALKYLVENKKEIFLPNVKELSKEKKEYLEQHEHFIRLGFDPVS